MARIELGTQTYNVIGRLNDAPAAIINVFQLPGYNAVEAVNGVREMMAQLKEQFPDDVDYVVSLDTTLSVREGIKEIVTTLWEALLLVIFVVFIFLQSFGTTLIPALTVPVSLLGTFIFFPMLGFSINSLSLFGLVLAIGLVVDDAIVVVEAVELNMAAGLSPKDASLKAMEQVGGPVVAIALILAAVFVPTAFIPGITGRLYQQFAVTIAISVIISAFNALSLSPALCSLLLKPAHESHGLLQRFFGGFNRVFAKATTRYVGISGALIRKMVLSLTLLAVVAGLALLMGGPLAFRVPSHRRSRIFLFEHPTSRCRLAAAHRRLHQRSGIRSQAHQRRRILQHHRRQQPSHPDQRHLQRLRVRRPQAVGRAKDQGDRHSIHYGFGQR